MAGDQGDDALVHQDVSAGGDAHVAGRDLHVHQTRILFQVQATPLVVGRQVPPVSTELADRPQASQRPAEAPGGGDQQATPGEFRHDLATLLGRLERQARTRRLPAYLPAGRDAVELSRTARIRLGLRPGPPPDLADAEAGRIPGGSREPSQSWPDVVAAHRQLIVLADPGLGKSWLIRSETLRLCRDALSNPGGRGAGAPIPVSLRCDQLAASRGRDLAEKAARYMAEQGLLAERSCARLAALIRRGEAVLLLDALDEVTPAQEAVLRAALEEWADQAGAQARCVITSRIAGYTGMPLPRACEVELQGFADADVAAVIGGWGLQPAAASRLRGAMQDARIAAMARNPLLLALMCSLAASPGQEDLPVTRGQLVERVLRWFLTRPHRRADRADALVMDDLAVSALLDLLGPVASAFAGQPGGWVDLMSQSGLLAAIREAGPVFTELGRPAPEVLRELSVRAGILVPAGDPTAGRSPRYLFVHRAVTEYLVARHLAALPGGQWLAAVEQHRWFDPDWAEVMPLLGEQLAPAAARQMVEHLAAAEADPFHHSLLTSIRVWGTRPDADELLPAAPASELAGRLAALLQHPADRARIVSWVMALPYLPRPLLAQLARLADDSDPGLREAAARMLARRDVPDAADCLLGLLADPDLDVRWAAAEALDKRQRSTVTLGTLVDLLDYPDPGVRWVVAQVLQGRAGPALTGKLLDMLSSPDQDVWFTAVQELEFHADPAVAEGLLGLLSHPDKEVRQLAAGALAGREAPGVTAALLSLLSEPDDTMRAVAARALGKQRGLDVTHTLLGLLGDQAVQVQMAAADALRSREGPGVTEGLLSLIRHPGTETTWPSASILAGRPEPEVAGILVDLARHPSKSVRYAAASGLADRHAPGATDALLALSRDPDAEVRYKAAVALTVRQEPHVTGALLSLFSDPDESVRAVAARGVASREDPRATQALLSLLPDEDQPYWPDWSEEAAARREKQQTGTYLVVQSYDPERSLRYLLDVRLAGREEPGLMAILMGLLRHPDSSVRSLAARALRGRDGPGTTSALLGLLADPHKDVRRAAVLALTDLEEPGVTEALLGLLSHPDADMQQAAIFRLGRRKGKAVTEALLGMLPPPSAGACPATADDRPPGTPGVSLDLFPGPAMQVPLAAIEAVASRDGANVTTALLTLLGHSSHHMRKAAGRALARREAPGAAGALLGLLRDPRQEVWWPLWDVLAGPEATLALADWARQNCRAGQDDLQAILRTAEELTTRNYREIAPSEQEQLRATMAWLTSIAADNLA